MIFNRDDATSLSTNKPAKLQLLDSEFGVISYRRSPHAKFVRLRVSEEGLVKASLPKRAPLYLVKELVDSSRDEIRKLIAAQTTKRAVYEDGMTVGRSHRLSLSYEAIAKPSKKIHNQLVTVVLPLDYRDDSTKSQQYICTQVKSALRREATAYLPRRLRYLADRFGFDYQRERFGNQRGRWGSCSSSGTISLNVALMNLPLELIDYVLVHELVHTTQMNHSPDFWKMVESCMPDYKERRKILKTMSPIC